MPCISSEVSATLDESDVLVLPPDEDTDEDRDDTDVIILDVTGTNP